MTDEQYWHGEPDLLQRYYEVYMQRIHQEAHLYGYYQYIAVSTALSNAFREKGKKVIPYIEKPLITEEYWNKKKITEENIDEEYKRGLNYQIDWVNALSNNK